jgi:hypothetical protein
MTPAAINAIVKPAIENGSLFYLSSTSIKSFYFERMDNIQFDDTNELISWTDTENGLVYYFDYADINMAVLRTPDSKLFNAVY